MHLDLPCVAHSLEATNAGGWRQEAGPEKKQKFSCPCGGSYDPNSRTSTTKHLLTKIHLKKFPAAVTTMVADDIDDQISVDGARGSNSDTDVSDIDC